MSFLDTFCQMLVILFAIALGYLANKLGYFSEEGNRKLTKVVLNITMPCMILASVMTSDNLPDMQSMLSLLKMIVLFYGVGVVFLLVFPKFLGGSDQQKGVWRYGLLFPNTAFIGYPVLQALFGGGAVFYGVILNLPFNLLSYSLGPLMLGGKRRFNWKSLCTPALITSFISLIIVLTRLRTPVLLGEMTAFVGDMTVPFSLLILGSVLAEMPIKQVFSMPRMWVFALIRLLLMPAALLVLLRPMGLVSMVYGVAVIEMAMPVAVNGAMLCMEYDGDTQCMAQTIFVSTMLSMVTIPVVAMFL